MVNEAGAAGLQRDRAIREGGSEIEGALDDEVALAEDGEGVVVADQPEGGTVSAYEIVAAVAVEGYRRGGPAATGEREFAEAGGGGVAEDIAGGDDEEFIADTAGAGGEVAGGFTGIDLAGAFEELVDAVGASAEREEVGADDHGDASLSTRCSHGQFSLARAEGCTGLVEEVAGQRDSEFALRGLPLDAVGSHDRDGELRAFSNAEEEGVGRDAEGQSRIGGVAGAVGGCVS